MAWKKFAKRIGRKIVGAAKQRYMTKSGKGLRIGQIAKDVSMLKTLVNAEKKRLQSSSTGGAITIGQCANASGSGHYLLDVTPLPAQGTGYNQRTGNSVKWISSHYDMQFVHMTNTIQPMKLKIFFVQVKGTPYATMSNVMGQFIAANGFTTNTIYDYSSTRVADYFKNFRVIRTRTVNIQPDSYSGVTIQKTFKVGFKLRNHHIRWATDGTTLSEGQIFMLIVADSGNAGTNVATTGGVVITTAQTGVYFNYNRTDYFTDN